MEGWNGNDPLQANAGVHKHPALNQLHEFQCLCRLSGGQSGSILTTAIIRRARFIVSAFFCCIAGQYVNEHGARVQDEPCTLLCLLSAQWTNHRRDAGGGAPLERAATLAANGNKSTAGFGINNTLNEKYFTLDEGNDIPCKESGRNSL